MNRIAVFHQLHLILKLNKHLNLPIKRSLIAKWQWDKVINYKTYIT